MMASAEANSALPTSPKYSWRRFSLRALMLLTATIAIWCGWVVNKARFYREQYASIQELQTRFPNTVSLKPVANEWFWRPLVGDAAVTVKRAYLCEYRHEQSRYELTDEDVRRIKHWTGVEDLNLAGPAITDETISLVGRFPELIVLNLENTAITDAGTAYIAPLNGLQILYIYTIRDRASPPGAGITEAALRNLVVGKDLGHFGITAPISDDGLALIAESCPNINRLQLFETRITSAGMRQLRRLTKLYEVYITHNKLIDDAAIQQLVGLPVLKSIYLEGTHVTERGAQALEAEIPGLQVRLQP